MKLSNIGRAGVATALAGAILAGPSRTRPTAGLALGLLVARWQAQNIDTTNAGAYAAAERGGRRWTTMAGEQFMLKARLDQLERAVADSYVLLNSTDINDFHRTSLKLRVERRTRNIAHRQGWHLIDPDNPAVELDLDSGCRVIHPTKPEHPITYLPPLSDSGI